jgi:hypothetical protein
MDVRLWELARKQADVVAAWQLMDIGWSRDRISHHARRLGWQRVFRGVYVLTRAPLTRQQCWMAASLSTRESCLSHASAGACWGFRAWEGAFETITRPGGGGPRRHGGLLVCRSATLAGEMAVRQGMRITTVDRTLIDLAAYLDARQVGRATREAMRLKLTTSAVLSLTLERHATHRGTALLRQLATRYATIPYARTRSNPEARALELLHDAGVEPPQVNIRIAGEEADLVWREERLIIEIDGPQYHLFADEDARKQVRWEKAGFTVRRLPSDAVYTDPGRLLGLAPSAA